MSKSNVSDPATPRRVLVCVSGMSPAVVTETLYALIQPEHDFVPDEIHVVTTGDGKRALMKELLDPEKGQFHAFKREYLRDRQVLFTEAQIHVIGYEETVAEAAAARGVWAGLDRSPAPRRQWKLLDDIPTDADNRVAADTLFRVVRRLKSERPTRLHASVAGGRKSMSFYMGHVFSLLSEPGDSLSHVLVNAPFEQTRPKFYYPPKESHVELAWKDREGNDRTVSTAEARIQLAELSVLHLGPVLGTFPIGSCETFQDAVQLAQATLVPGPLKLSHGGGSGRFEVQACGRRVHLPPQRFAALAVYAWARVHADELPEGDAVRLTQLPAGAWRELLKMLEALKPEEQEPLGSTTLKPVHTGIGNAFKEALGPAARHYLVKRVGRKADPHTAAGKPPSAYRLVTEPELIDLSGLRGLDRCLRDVLGVSE